MDKMPMCRVCLVENVRMYIVNDKDLQELYETLTDIPFVTEDRRPILACFLCFAKLKQCCQLQRKCLEAEELFAQMMNEPNLSVNRGQLKYSSGLIVTPVENISIVDGSHIESINVKEESPAVSEKIDDVIEPKKEHLEYELELELLSKSYSDATDIPAQLSKPEPEYDVRLIEIKTEVVEEEEEEEEPRKKRRASDTTRAVVAKKQSLQEKGIQGRKLEDVITEIQKKNEDSDSTFSQNTQSGSSKLIPKFSKYLTKITPLDNTSVTLDPKCRNNINKRNVTKHIRLRTGGKPYKCDVCQRSFIQRQHLTNHIRTHTKEKPYECDVCLRCFTQKVHLTSHIRMHTGKKPYKCDKCQLGFTRKDYLKRHIITHSGEKPYKCEECQTGFVSKDYLTRHICTHTREKRYKCEMCQSSFNMKSDLKRHSRIHNDEKPFKCNECHLCFRQKAHLVGHIRTHSDEKPYKCDICQRSFNLKSSVTKHNKRVHTDEKPYKCDICPRIFHYKASLIKHIGGHSRPEGVEDTSGGATRT